MVLILYSLVSNSQSICFLFFFLNHFMYASLESFVFPLLTLAYAILEQPRPNPIFWKVLLYYSEFIIFAKFAI